MTLDSSPLKWFIKFDKVDQIITYKALKDNRLLGEYDLVLSVSSDTQVRKHQAFKVKILPDCSIETMYDVSLRKPMMRVPNELSFTIVDPATEYYSLVRQYKSSASFCPLGWVVEHKNTAKRVWEPLR